MAESSKRWRWIAAWYETLIDKITGRNRIENITYQLLPILTLARLGGNWPITASPYIDRFGNKGVVYNYSYSLKSWAFFLTIFVGIPTLLLWLLLFLTSGLGIGTDWKIRFLNKEFSTTADNAISRVDYLVLVVFHLIIPLSRLIEITGLWISTPTLVSILNKFNEIDNDLILYSRKFNMFQVKVPCLVNKAKINITGRRNFLISFYLLLPSILTLPFVLYNQVFCLSGVNSYLAEAIRVYLTISSIHIPLIEDANVDILYKCVAESFKQVRVEIENIFKTHEIKKICEICREDVVNWGRLILKIRKQCESIGQNQAIHQFLPLAGQSIWIACAMYVVVQNVVNGLLILEDQFSIIFICFGVSASYIARLLFQVKAAVEITKEEEILATTLVELHGELTVVATRAEVRNICDLLLSKPSMISFYGFITLNKAFLMGFASQITTFFIVLTQFNNS